MKNKTVNFFAALIFLCLVLAGCGSNAEVDVKVDNNMDIVVDELLMIEYQDMERTWGDLYLYDTGEQIEIDSKVLGEGVIITPERKIVAYSTRNEDLYIKKTDVEKSLVSSNVVPGSVQFSKDENTIGFLVDRNGQILYTCKLNEDKVKIADGVKNFSLSDNGAIVYYELLSGGTFAKSSEGEEKTIAGGSSDAILSHDKEHILFRGIDGGTYFKNVNDRKAGKISDRNVDIYNSEFVRTDSSKVFYLDEFNFIDLSGELKMCVAGKRPKTIASAVKEFKVSDDGQYVYYFNNDGSLYMADASNGNKEKISDNVLSFMMFEGGRSVAYKNKEFTLFQKNIGEDSIEIMDLVYMYTAKVDRFIWLNDAMELYERTSEGNNLIADDVKAYMMAENGRTVCYADTSSRVVVNTDGQNSNEINELSYRSKVFYKNIPFLQGEMTIPVISGHWVSDNGYAFIVGEDGSFSKYENNEETYVGKLEKYSSSYDNIICDIEEKSLRMLFEFVGDENTLEIDNYYVLYKVDSSMYEDWKKYILINSFFDKVAYCEKSVVYYDTYGSEAEKIGMSTDNNISIPIEDVVYEDGTIWLKSRKQILGKMDFKKYSDMVTFYELYKDREWHTFYGKIDTMDIYNEVSRSETIAYTDFDEEAVVEKYCDGDLYEFFADGKLFGVIINGNYYKMKDEMNYYSIKVGNEYFDLYEKNRDYKIYNDNGFYAAQKDGVFYLIREDGTMFKEMPDGYYSIYDPDYEIVTELVVSEENGEMVVYNNGKLYEINENLNPGLGGYPEIKVLEQGIDIYEFGLREFWFQYDEDAMYVE